MKQDASHRKRAPADAPAPQMTTGSPSWRPERSMPARETARGSRSAPSSQVIDSGRRWSQAAGWRWLQMEGGRSEGVPSTRQRRSRHAQAGEGAVEGRRREEDDVRAGVIAADAVRGDVHHRSAPLDSRLPEGSSAGRTGKTRSRRRGHQPRWRHDLQSSTEKHPHRLQAAQERGWISA